MRFLKKNYISKAKEQRIYKQNIPTIGLTGGIATGKSSMSRYLEELGLPVICADKLVKSIYTKQETIEFINKNYPEVIEKDQIDFKKLRKVFFSDNEVQKKVEDFIYEKLPTAYLEAVARFHKPAIIIYDVPLLFEKGLDQKVDLSILVFTSPEIQVKRLMKRDDISKNLALSIISKQIPINAKKERSDFIIDNSGTLANSFSQIDRLLNDILTLKQ